VGSITVFYEKDKSMHEKIAAVRNRLVSFFYLLMRDYVSIGQVNKLVENVCGDELPCIDDEILVAKVDSIMYQLQTGKHLMYEIEAAWSMPVGASDDVGTLVSDENLVDGVAVYGVSSDKKGECDGKQKGV
jgi:hypothetical protein